MTKMVLSYRWQYLYLVPTLLISLFLLFKVIKEGTKDKTNLMINKLTHRSLYDPIRQKLVKTAQLMYKAKRHARGSKTSDSLKSAISLMEGILVHLQVNLTDLKSRPVKEAVNICPETYKGTTFGYPFFYQGFEVTDCPSGKKVEDLITIVTFIEFPEPEAILAARKLLDSLKSQSKKFTIILAVKKLDKQPDDFSRKYKNFKLVTAENSDTPGVVWNRLLKEVTTEYVLIARNVDMFTNDSRLDRLIREIESLDVAVAAGSYREPTGHWRIGCLQLNYRNYSISFFDGYDESIHECQFCDYVTGPFVMKTSLANELQFDLSIPSTGGLFEDLFMRLKEKGLEAITCPDAMYHTVEANVSDISSDWETFAIKWKAKYIQPAGSKSIEIDCSHFICKKDKAYTLHPCCLDELTDMILFVMRTCEEEGIICELQEGTALGAVKFNKILPWERDGDLAFLTSNYSTFSKLAQAFTGAGYTLKDLQGTWCCADSRIAGGKFQVKSKSWIVEMYGQHIMDSELLIEAGLKPTKVLFSGRWVNVPRNPGLFVRNRYAHEIYQHALHWMVMEKKSGWEYYKTNTFIDCPRVGDHACFDRYNGDGNIQFMLSLP
ncbi:hypothetical protein CHS0354_021210 [Potamilus streckersoni]|uniref:LicD/FKTN/FKRP nucleotidyltransferase domain-containing protein n=1 Tax=Potamilus streckersoni TaxID=2493646 RepID=A0AAE0W049_9BIVA|nr:hypothetical protein CHS0354_021210 [Potamilus streckersoni]